MLLPEQIKTKKKIRDARIIQMYSDGKTLEEIGAKFGITDRAVSFIVYKNAHLLELDRTFEKAKRMNRLRRVLEIVPDKLSSKKDVLNVLEQMRKETEGDQSNLPQVKNVIQIIMPAQNNELEAVETVENVNNMPILSDSEKMPSETKLPQNHGFCPSEEFDKS